MKTKAAILHNSFISKSLRIALIGLLLCPLTGIKEPLIGNQPNAQFLAPYSRIDLPNPNRDRWLTSKEIQNEVLTALKSYLQENQTDLSPLFNVLPELERLQLMVQIMNKDEVNLKLLTKILRSSNILELHHTFEDKHIKQVLSPIFFDLISMIRPILL